MKLKVASPVTKDQAAEMLGILDDAERAFNAWAAQLVVDAVMEGGERCEQVTRNMLRTAAWHRARGAQVFTAIRAALDAGVFLDSHELPPPRPSGETP